MNDSLNNSEQQFFEKIEKIMEVYANSGLGKWFGKGGGGSSSGGGWDRYNTSGNKVGKCGDAAKGSSYSACLGKKYVARLRSKNGKKAVANWVKRKKAAQNKQGRGKKGSSSKGNSPIAVKYTIKEQTSMPTNYPAQLRKIVKKLQDQILTESHDLVLQQAGAALNKAHTAEDFMRGFVGKRLTDLLDAGSFANLYVMNKYGIGSEYDEQDDQVLLNKLWQAATGFINNRVLEPISKQRKVWDAENYAKPQYTDWKKQRALVGKAYRDARDSESADADELKKQFVKLNSEDPTLGDYRNMMDDMESVVQQFHNKALTLKDVLPSSDDTDQDKKNWASVEKLYSNIRKNKIKEQTNMSKNYPAVKIFVSTVGGGIRVLMWKQQNFDREVGSDANVKTYGNFARLIGNLGVDPSKLMTSDRDAVQVLKFLSSSEIRQLANKESVITTSIPPEIVHKFSADKNLQETDSMTKNQIFKKLIRSIIAEEFKGNPNDAAEVESDKLTAHLSEDSVADDIKDLEALLANPDASRAKDYGSIENYKKMLRSKIARLKGGEAGMAPEYRVRSDEPAPFGYGLDEKGDVKKVSAKALDQTKDGVVDTGDAVVASRKEKIALSTGNKADAAFYKKIKTIVNKHKGSKL